VNSVAERNASAARSVSRKFSCGRRACAGIARAAAAGASAQVLPLALREGLKEEEIFSLFEFCVDFVNNMSVELNVEFISGFY
jgi:hypothetical protein